MIRIILIETSKMIISYFELCKWPAASFYFAMVRAVTRIKVLLKILILIYIVEKYSKARRFCSCFWSCVEFSAWEKPIEVDAVKHGPIWPAWQAFKGEGRGGGVWVGMRSHRALLVFPSPSPVECLLRRLSPMFCYNRVFRCFNLRAGRAWDTFKPFKLRDRDCKVL